MILYGIVVAYSTVHPMLHRMQYFWYVSEFPQSATQLRAAQTQTVGAVGPNQLPRGPDQLPRGPACSAVTYTIFLFAGQGKEDRMDRSSVTHG
jgi:hypothetical protein